MTIILERLAKRSVPSVSVACSASGEMVHTIAMRALPDRAGCRRRVSFESRYGIWFVEEVLGSVSLDMTVARVRSDLLMKAPSLARFASVVALSDPARSIRLSLELLSTWPPCPSDPVLSIVCTRQRVPTTTLHVPL